METWTGFSSEDIKNVQLSIKKSDKKNVDQHFKECVQHSGVKTSKLQKSYKRPVPNFASGKESSHQLNYYPVPQEALLAQQSNETLDISSNSSLETSSTVSSQNLSAETSPKQSSGGEAKALTILVGDDKSYEMIPSSMSENLPLKVNNNLNGNGSSFAGSHQKAFLLENDSKQHQDKSSLEKFQERQKLMEEQNKRKKELLTKAIADRKRQTQFEAKKLLQVQEELSRLDALLSTDVGILRNQIELSAYEFNEAQKRYDRAESEFIEAKLHLFNKLERKELLTEHLCKIIEVNEQRKARKLSELMAKLEISDEKGGEARLAGLEDHAFLQADGLNEITYTACTTLKHPVRNNSSSESLTHTQTLLRKNNNTETVTKNDFRHAEEPPSIKAPSKGNNALQSLNLITAQNLDHRNESAPCDLNSYESS